MSCVFVVVPMVVGGFPVFAGLAAGVAAQMGLKALAAASKSVQATAATTVHLDVENIETIAAGIRADDKLSFSDGRIVIVIARDARGKCTVHVEGPGVSKAELQATGEKFLHQIMQQYAYQKVQTELERQGFSVVSEDVQQDRSIRLKFRKFE